MAAAVPFTDATNAANAFLSPRSALAAVAEKAMYPHSLLEQRKERAFTFGDFDIQPEEIGSGRFGKVYKAREKRSRQVVVLKTVEKAQVLDEGVVRQLQREVETHARLDHAHILKMYAYFHDEQRCCMVLEYASGGTLYEKVQKTPIRRVTESVAAEYIRQLCCALAYLHKRNVLHRDIKPENLLLCIDKKTNKETLKLADFGWTVAQRVNSCRTTLCGTVEYLPPELCRDEAYDSGFDMWTVGVLAYELLVGESPFAPHTAAESAMDMMMERIKRGRYTLPLSLTSGARDLIAKLLAPMSKDRMKAHEVLEHPWIVRLAGPTPAAAWDY